MRRRRLGPLGRPVLVRVDEQRALLVEEAHAGAGALRRLGEDRRVARIREPDPRAEVGLAEGADDHRLVAHVALEREEELALVDARELQPRDGHEEHEEVDHEEADADAPEDAKEALAHRATRPRPCSRCRGRC